ncbi:MAG TPA: SpoIIE family protein phosphatase [Chloroflexota bacterium]|nr:SpoIIE family protein phosphatase [Chloroflexota bacterium]
MTVSVQTLWSTVRRRRLGRSTAQLAETARPTIIPVPEIAPNDPLVAYLQSVAAAVDIEDLELDSPALRQMRDNGVQMVVPLVSQGELIGLLCLGPRLSQQEYSADDRTLLNNLAAQATPAVRVAQLVRQQEAEAQERERIEHELQVARLIQHTLLPKTLPELSGWQLAAYYQPAREVGGDFYDFIELSDNRLGIVVGDVTDKGVPAALVMATTRSLMRAAGQQLDSPGAVLERVNEALYPDIPENMFVTCLYAVLDTATGQLRYANAGHDLPYRRHGTEAIELRATGMPLGLLPGMAYEEKETVLEPGDSLLLYSDGLVEAHNQDGDMFGFPRTRELIGGFVDTAGTLIDFLLTELSQFTGSGWEQEDDITLVTISCSAAHRSAWLQSESEGQVSDRDPLAAFTVSSVPGNERIVMDRVAEAAAGLDLPETTLEQLKTAVAEATMNAMEHGNHYQEDMPVAVEVLHAADDLIVRITDQGEPYIPENPEIPDLDAKLAGLQSPRGWGLFLIQNMVDEMNVTNDDSGHTIELIVHLKGETHGSPV